MKIRKKIMTLPLFLLGIVVGSCESEVALVSPVITTDPFEPAPLDTVTTTLIGELQVDGEEVDIDSYDWVVTDPASNELTLISSNNEVMLWKPTVEGVHTVQVTVTSGNKSVTEIKQFNVKHTTGSIQKYLAGNWHGDGSAPYAGGITWEADFSIATNGHYAGAVTVVHTGSIVTVFDNGVDTADDPEKKFVVNTIDGNGYALGDVRFVHFGGDLLTYQFEGMIFSNNYNTVAFTVDVGISYVLTRI
jgi:hypothetical protein